MKALGIGEAPLDISCVVASYPLENQKHQSEELIKSVGGPVPAGLLLLQRLGCTSQLITQLGTDLEAETVQNYLEEQGIAVAATRSTHTKVNWYLVNARTGSRTGIKTTPGHTPLTKVDAQAISQAQIIMLDRHELACFAQIKETASPSAVIMIDPSSDNSPEVMACLADTTVPVVPVELLKKEFPTADLSTATKQLANTLDSAVVVTAGSFGSVVYQNNQLTLVPPVEITCIDALGAGDVFRAALALKLAQKEELLDAVAYANAIAGMQCQRVGNGTAIPNTAELSGWRSLKAKQVTQQSLHNWYHSIAI